MLDGYRYQGRHRRPSAAGRTAARLASASAAVVIPLAVAAPAEAASDSTWDRLAQCESSGRWNYNGASGYDGGLQFLPRTWTAFGGGDFAQYAYQASRAEQIVVAERVLAVQGWNAWPACSKKLGIRGESASPRKAQKAEAPKAKKSSKSAGKPKAEHSKRRASASVEGSYVVKSGDTLSGIAAVRGTTWQELYAANRGVVEQPNLIYPGERLKV